MNERSDRIRCAGPSITDKEVEYVTDAVRTAWYSDAGKYHDRFERAAADYFGVRHTISTPTGTSAIHLALWALGVGPGDEVIVPELTWIGSSAPISYLGAQPVFADVDADSLCLSARSFESAITPRTKAVIVVDLFGNLPDVSAIREVAARHGVAVVEDAAQALGSTWKDRHAGTLGDVGIFSFHGSKTVTTGEGGMLVTDNHELHQRALSLRDHGRRVTDDRFIGDFDRYYYHFEIGNKFKMSSLQAALGLAQIERADELVAKKHAHFQWYRELLADVTELDLCEPTPPVKSSYWMPVVKVDPSLGIRTRQLLERLEQRQIDIRPCYYPLSSQPAYAEFPSAQAAPERNRTAYEVSPYTFCLPSNLLMTRDDVARVAHALREVIEELRAEPHIPVAESAQ